MKLTKSVYLLVLLIEECAEVIQRACKAIRFGLADKEAGQDLNNFERLEIEAVDLQVSVQLNQREGNLPLEIEARNQTRIKDKFVKVERFMELSRRLGTLE